MRIRRLEEVAEAVAALATTDRARRVGQLLLAVALVFVLLRFRRLWNESGFSWHRVDWTILIGSLGVAGAAVTGTAFIWLSILHRLGVRAHRRLVGVFFEAQLSKYIPGSVWQYAGRTSLAKANGLPVRPVAASLGVEIAASVLAGGAVALFVFGVPGIVAALVVVALLAALGRFSTRRAIAGPVSAAVPYVAVWVALGIGFWLTARALFAVPSHDLPAYVGAFAIAWIVGFVAIYAPGGIGVREAVLVALLRGRLGSADALVLAVTSRLVLAVVDVVAAAAGAVILRTRQPTSSPTYLDNDAASADSL